MTMNEGSQRSTRPVGELLEAGARVRAAGASAARFELVADDGATALYRGDDRARAARPVAGARRAASRRDDLGSYEPRWGEPGAVGYLGGRIATRAGLSRRAAAAGAAAAAPRPHAGGSGSSRSRRPSPPRRSGRLGETTNLVDVDRDGNACVLTTSLGLGSGDWLPGLDLHLNSMLGEADLDPRAAGGRTRAWRA